MSKIDDVCKACQKAYSDQLKRIDEYQNKTIGGLEGKLFDLETELNTERAKVIRLTEENKRLDHLFTMFNDIGDIYLAPFVEKNEAVLLDGIPRLHKAYKALEKENESLKRETDRLITNLNYISDNWSNACEVGHKYLTQFSRGGESVLVSGIPRLYAAYEKLKKENEELKEQIARYGIDER